MLLFCCVKTAWLFNNSELKSYQRSGGSDQKLLSLFVYDVKTQNVYLKQETSNG